MLSLFVRLALELNLPVRSGSRAIGECLRKHGLACPDVVIGFPELKGSLDALFDALERERASGPSQVVVEVSCHPGIWDRELETRATPRYSRPRERELELLSDPGIWSRLVQSGWRYSLSRAKSPSSPGDVA